LYETIIVKNGNITINKDLTKAKFGIIVLKDGYDVKSDYKSDK
jgi:hypothetical protein